MHVMCKWTFIEGHNCMKMKCIYIKVYCREAWINKWTCIYILHTLMDIKYIQLKHFMNSHDIRFGIYISYHINACMDIKNSKYACMDLKCFISMLTTMGNVSVMLCICLLYMCFVSI